MTEDTRGTVRHHLVAIGRDILVLGSLCGMLGGLVIAVSRPYWKPFAELPQNVVTIQRQIVEIQQQLNENVRPEIVSFRSALAVNSAVVAGETIAILYHLRRHASCETEVEPIFLNVDLNLPFYGTIVPDQRAPLTDEYINFIVTVPIPRNLPPGRYVYSPRITPIECGVYQQQRVPPTTIFEVSQPPSQN